MAWYHESSSDLRFAARSLARRPWFAALAILTLALGIGATTTLFGVVKQVLLTPLPYRDPSSIAVVWSAWKGFDQTWLSYDEWEGWKARVPAFAGAGIYSDGLATFGGGARLRVRVASLCSSAMQILGLQRLQALGALSGRRPASTSVRTFWATHCAAPP